MSEKVGPVEVYLHLTNDGELMQESAEPAGVTESLATGCYAHGSADRRHCYCRRRRRLVVCIKWL